jgi:hypothetical protein
MNESRGHSMRWLAAAAIAVIATLSHGAQAAIVVLNLDMPLDRVAPDQRGMKVGDHHRARIFYDDTSINPKTHRVPVIHMEHWMGRWVPEALGDATMPMPDAWLDLGSKPYRYHYKAAAVIGDPVVVEFNDRTRRMTISKQSDMSMLISAPYTIDPTPVPGLSLRVVTAPAITMLNMTVTLDQAAAGEPGKVGDVDHLRLVYDANQIDSKTQRVKLLNFQHLMNGKWLPAAPDAVMMPTDDSWLDTGTVPYRLHFKARVVHGKPIVIDVSEDSRRLTIRPQTEPMAILESGAYVIDPTPVSGPEANGAGTAPDGPPPVTAR